MIGLLAMLAAFLMTWVALIVKMIECNRLRRALDAVLDAVADTEGKQS